MNKIMKHLIVVILLVFIVGSSVYASDEVEVVIPSFPICLNDASYDSSDAMYPLINFNGITYLPMTWNMAQSLGLNIKYSEYNGLEIELGQPTGNLEYEKGSQNSFNTYYKASLASYKITVNGEVIDNTTEEYPILNFRGITYFPLTWRYAVEEFEWHYSYSNESGLDIIANSKSEPIIQEVVIEDIETSEHRKIVEITNSFRTANQWRLEDDFLYLGLAKDDISLNFSLESEDVSFLDSSVDYHLFAYIVELYSGNEMTYKATLYENYDVNRKFRIGLGDPCIIHPKDFEDIDRLVYRIQFMQSDQCEEYFENSLIETVDLSKQKNFRSYIESKEETYFESVVVGDEIMDKTEATRTINILPDAVKERYNILYNFGSGFGSDSSIDEATDILSERLSMNLISTVERADGTLNLIENRKKYIDDLPMTDEFNYMRRFEYSDGNNGKVSLYFLLDKDFNIKGYID